MKDPEKGHGDVPDKLDFLRSEAALIASETRYRRLFETAQDGILILDAETGMIQDVNPFLIDLLGFTKDQFIDKAIWEIGFFKDVAANQDKFQELQQKEYVRYENLPLETAGGRRINVEFVSNVYLVNNQKVIQCNIRDITERKMTENRTELSTGILSLLNTTLPFNETIDHILHKIQQAFSYDAVGIRFKNGDDYPYFIQNGFSDDFLRTENTLLGRTQEGVVCRDKDGMPCLECTCGLVVSGKTGPPGSMFTEGGSFWTNNSKTLLDLTEDEEPRINPRNRCIHEGFLSVALIPVHHLGEIVGLLQINDRKKDRFTPVMIRYLEGIGETIGVALMREKKEVALLESEALYRKLNETLEARIAARTIQLETINRKLEFHLSEVEQFGYLTNHDLQEPLRTLIQFSHLLGEEYSDKLDENGRKYLAFIHSSGLRMQQLVMDLREYYVIGKEGLPTIADCNEIVESVLADLGDAIRESGAEITVGHLPAITCFETDIRLLFQNLLANAIKFRKKGVIPEISISAEKDGTDWLFTIKDNGIGIDGKHHEKVFIIFQRLHKRTEYEGTGIGLAHCKKIVELHGGRIWIEPAPGIGSTFLFSIPKS